MSKIITGCSTLQELYDTNDGFLTTLSELRIVDSTVKTGFTIQNVVCTAQLDGEVDLNTLSIALGLESIE